MRRTIIFNIKSVFNLFFPKRCLCCSCHIQINSLCDDCHSLCNICENPLFFSQKNYQGALFYYELAIRKLIMAAKFSFSEHHALALMNLIDNELIRSESVLNLKTWQASAVTYIPTRVRSRLWRGFDLPELFAHRLAKYLDIPVVHLICNNGFRPRQSLIKSRAQRKLAIKDSFKLAKQTSFWPRLILVDDIITTGATFDESTKILHSICSDIRCLAIAKTP